MGAAQLLTQVGAVPLAFEIEARSLGEAAERSQVGKKADLALYDLDALEWTPRHDVVRNLIYCADGRSGQAGPPGPAWRLAWSSGTSATLWRRASRGIGRLPRCSAVPPVAAAGLDAARGRSTSQPGISVDLKGTEVAARALGVQLPVAEARSTGELDRAFAAIARERVAGIVVLPSTVLYASRARIAQLAAKHRLPTSGWVREFPEAGCLMSYGANQSDVARRAAYFVDKILKGAKPADLPVEQPTKFELVINLKTAKALGLTIPPSLLGRADEIIH